MASAAELRNDVARAQEALLAAQAKLDEANEVAWAARKAESDAREAQREQAIQDDTDEAGYYGTSEDLAKVHEAGYILPLGKDYSKVNVLASDTFPFGGRKWMENATVYVMSKPERTRPTRAFVGSSGTNEHGEWAIGNVWKCYHDQTGANLGTYTVVGIVQYGTQGQVIKVVGEVPTTKLSLSVFK